MKKGEEPIYDVMPNGARREICGAKRRTDGKPCRAAAMANGRCRNHGGALPKPGPTHHNYKHGKYSEVMPNLRLKQRYERAMNDDEWASMRNEIALIDMRLNELLEAIDIGGAPAEAWREALLAFTRMDEALISGDIDAAKQHRITLKETLEKGFDLMRSWDQIIDIIHDRRLVVESERRRSVELAQVLTVEQSLSLIKTMANVVELITENESKRRAKEMLAGLLSPRTASEARMIEAESRIVEVEATAGAPV